MTYVIDEGNFLSIIRFILFKLFNIVISFSGHDRLEYTYPSVNLRPIWSPILLSVCSPSPLTVTPWQVDSFLMSMLEIKASNALREPYSYFYIYHMTECFFSWFSSVLSINMLTSQRLWMLSDTPKQSRLTDIHIKLSHPVQHRRQTF